MDDQKLILKEVETGIREAARAVGHFADEVAAPEEPVVSIPDEAALPKPPVKSG